MYINSIVLHNYRIYKGVNTISFPRDSDKNIFIISGNNGFGKTTFLTSLIWCLYGKQMNDVDDKFKREIAENNGYKNYAKLNLNNTLRLRSAEYDLDDNERKNILKKGYSLNNNKHTEFRCINEYSVTITFSEVYIPSIPCEKVSITRTFDVFKETETVEILIDGKTNELSKDVGADIFINDFILSKDIAKFFFFDSEKIVALAEMKSLDDRRRLSMAYSEVLGVKKYEDLRNNLENVRIKLRRKSTDITDKNKLNKLIKEAEELQKLILHLIENQNNIDDEISNKRLLSDQYQEKLIREGNSISISELNGLKELRDALRTKDNQLKNDLKELIELAPFAISGKKLFETAKQVDYESKHLQKDKNISIVNEKLLEVKSELATRISKTRLSDDLKKEFADIITKSFKIESIHKDLQNSAGKIIVDFSEEEENEFRAVYDNIRYSYSQVFRQLVKDEKNNKLFLNKTIRRITQAESNDDDLLIKELRHGKAKVEKQITDLEKESRKISENIGAHQKELSIKSKLIAELSKRVSLDDIDKRKDELAERLINELKEFLIKLRSDKKVSLEHKIRLELNKLMHKVDFVDKVRVDIDEDMIDIHLYGKDNQKINKDILSKGEQQLYATAILKVLVDESEIKFPVFIDSPLQKIDRVHSRKIISEFYPNISEQVILFFLLEKELSKDEYEVLSPLVNKTYIIKNSGQNSMFIEIEPCYLFENLER